MFSKKTFFTLPKNDKKWLKFFQNFVFFRKSAEVAWDLTPIFSIVKSKMSLKIFFAFFNSKKWRKSFFDLGTVGGATEARSHFFEKKYFFEKFLIKVTSTSWLGTTFTRTFYALNCTVFCTQIVEIVLRSTNFNLKFNIFPKWS